VSISDERPEPDIYDALNRANGALGTAVAALVVALLGCGALGYANLRAGAALHRVQAGAALERGRVDSLMAAAALRVQAGEALARRSVDSLRVAARRAEAAAAGAAAGARAAAAQQAALAARLGSLEGAQRSGLEQARTEIRAEFSDSLRVHAAPVQAFMARSEPELAGLPALREQLSTLRQDHETLAQRPDPVGLKLWRVAVTLGVPIGILTGVGR